MPLSSYGVLIGRAVDRRREGAGQSSPHYQIRLADQASTDYRAAVNVKSAQQPPDLLYLADDDFQHPVTAALAALDSVWNPLPSQADGASLDFIRANLFDPASMRPLPPELPGVDNDLADVLDHHVLRALADPAATLYIFGQRWGPEATTPDKIFGFKPGNGVHDVHMNQGNSGQFRGDNGVWQDGAVLIHFPGENRWVAIFLAFQSQAWHTDDETGNPLDAAPPPPAASGSEPVQIVAALINPIGPAPEFETVTLLNASPNPVDLTGWQLADRLKHTCPATPVELAPGTTLMVQVSDGVQLGNSGGLITLLDPNGIKAFRTRRLRLSARAGPSCSDRRVF